MAEYKSATAHGELSAFGRPEIIADPYDYYRELRETGTLSYDPALRAWLVARHADVVQALRDPSFSVRGNAGFLDRLPTGADDEFASLREFFGMWLSFSDPPAHSGLRAPWTKELSPRTVSRLRPEIEDIADHLAGKALLLGGCDFLVDFGSYPALVLARFLGLDYGQLLSLRPWIEDVGKFMATPTSATARRAQSSIEQWRSWLDEHLGRGNEGLLDALGTKDSGLSRDALFALFASLVTGPASREQGTNEPTVQFLAKSLHLLVENPELAESLRAEPDLIPVAVDELLRFEPPFHFVTRNAVNPVELGGERIERGQRVLLLLASANRDPELFQDPDRIHVGRPENKHVAFGFGSHYCLGAPLARLEIEVMLSVLLRRLPHLKRRSKARWRMEGGFRALEGISFDFVEEDTDMHALLDQVEALSAESAASVLRGEDHE